MAMSQKEKEELLGLVHLHGIDVVVGALAEDWGHDDLALKYERALRVCLFLMHARNHHKKVVITEEM